MNRLLKLELPEKVYNSLEEQVKQASQSPEALAVQLLTAATQPVIDDPLERFIGAFNSHGSDWADAHDKHFGRSVTETMRREERQGRADA